MFLRKATPEDANAVLALWKTAEASESVTDSENEVRRISTRENVAFILAVIDGRIVGSIIAAFDGWRANMYRLATHPACRRQGVARALVKDAEKAIAEWGAKRVTALVDKDHAWAVHFWEAVGYARDEKWSRHVRNL